MSVTASARPAPEVSLVCVLLAATQAHAAQMQLPSVIGRPSAVFFMPAFPNAYHTTPPSDTQLAVSSVRSTTVRAG